ncbi:MAG TPA: CHAT domain-containing protein [Thermoanaerobaculia bacterium]
MNDVVLDFRLDLDPGRGVFQVHLAAAGREARADFAFDFLDRRLGGTLERIEQGACPLDDLKEVGVNLWEGLMAGDVGALFSDLQQEARGDSYVLRLSLQDPRLEVLPWEALYYDDYEGGFGFLSCHPRYTIARAPVARLRTAAEPAPVEGKLRILVAIPAGSGLDSEREWRNLELAVERVRERVQIERLTGRITPDRLADRLHAEEWDVFHFIGHGEQTASGRTVVRLNGEGALEEEVWLDGEAFANLFFGTRVRLAVLNCCQGAMPDARRRMSGLGPFFLRAGVPAVVAMRYEIEDRAAIKFSQRFYQDFLTGRAPGRVDLAVESAREALFRNQTEDAARSFVTPVLFLAGGARVLDIASPGAAAEAAPAVQASAPRVNVPERLVRALAEGRCVPVIGPRVLTASQMRSGPAATATQELAQALAKSFNYPRERDFEICKAAGDWMDPMVLQWVCQLVQGKSEFIELTGAIKKACASRRPPALLSRIATWNVPALFSLYFDGFLEEAFEVSRRPVRRILGVDAPVPPGSDPLLIHVRGLLREEQSLVLTEEDHDLLWDRIARMTPEITNVVRGYPGRSLFFLGISPRDPLAKRLFSKLVENWSERMRGSVFFLCSGDEAGDPYWEKHRVVWINEDLEDLVEALTAAVHEGVPS